MNSIPVKDKGAGAASADIRDLIQTLQTRQETQAKAIRATERLNATLRGMAEQGGGARLISARIASVVGEAGRAGGGSRPSEPSQSDPPLPSLLQPLSSLLKEGGVKEQVTNGETGFLYEFDAMEDWKQHFTTLVQDGERRTRMSATAARSFWKLTTHAEMLHAYRTLLMKLATTAQRGEAA